MELINQVESLLRFLGGLLWPLGWLGVNRPLLALMVLVGLFVIMLDVGVIRKRAFQFRSRQLYAGWNKMPPPTKGRAPGVIWGVITGIVWFISQGVVLLSLGLESPELSSRLWFLVLPLGVMLVFGWFLKTFQRIFIARKRAEVEFAARSATPLRAPAPGTPGIPGILGYRADFYQVGYGTALVAVILDIVYVVTVLGCYWWVASLVA